MGKTPAVTSLSHRWSSSWMRYLPHLYFEPCFNLFIQGCQCHFMSVILSFFLSHSLFLRIWWKLWTFQKIVYTYRHEVWQTKYPCFIYLVAWKICFTCLSHLLIFFYFQQRDTQELRTCFLECMWDTFPVLMCISRQENGYSFCFKKQNKNRTQLRDISCTKQLFSIILLYDWGICCLLNPYVMQIRVSMTVNNSN